MNRLPFARVIRPFRRTALPLAAYYAVTLAVPLANGAARSGAFVPHALAVLVVPLVGIVLVCAVHALLHTLTARSSARRAVPSIRPREEEPWAQTQRQAVR
jgi:hypothetical protein